MSADRTWPDQARLEPWVRAALRCPACHGELSDAATADGPELRCAACSLGYPVRNGIPVLLVADARTLEA